MFTCRGIHNNGWPSHSVSGLALWPFTRIFITLIVICAIYVEHLRLRLSSNFRALSTYLSPISEAVRATLVSSGILGQDAYVVLAGPANTYTHYVTTREEYSVQRYEGASTLFGPCKYSLVFFIPVHISGTPGWGCVARYFPDVLIELCPIGIFS